jgi:FPC/CPF motif-containing protein YcgG
MRNADNPFPCIFGVEAVVRRTLRYAFIDDAGGQAENLASALKEFTQVCHTLGKRTSLVCFFESWADQREHAAYYKHFWQLLSSTSQLDPQPWPIEVSATTDDPAFEYSFNGHALFVVVNTDLHDRRRSRHFDRVAITFQPRFVFDDIAAGSKKGDAARQIIRGRLSQYDSVATSNLLGSFGDDKNREWTQYYLDDGESIAALEVCPVDHFRTNSARYKDRS